MGQVISIFLRWTKRDDGVDNNPLISPAQGLSHCIDIYPSTQSHAIVGDAIANLEEEEAPLIIPTRCSDVNLVCNDDHDTGTETVCDVEEIKDIIVNKQGKVEELDGRGLGGVTKVSVIDHGTIEVVMTKEVIVDDERKIGHYASSQKMLLVGEGDFSFSASLAQAFGFAVNMLATSLDSQEFLSKNYTRAMGNIAKLTGRGCIVLHGVDCTKMADMFSSMKFDRIIYNFPHAGFCGRDEPRESQLCRHQTLVSMFLANAKRLVKEGGEIHITHKSKGFFLQWDIKSLASNEGLVFLEEVPFNRKDYPGYRTMYGFGGNKFFYCCPSKTYKFGLGL